MQRPKSRNTVGHENLQVATDKRPSPPILPQSVDGQHHSQSGPGFPRGVLPKAVLRLDDPTQTELPESGEMSLEKSHLYNFIYIYIDI